MKPIYFFPKFSWIIIVIIGNRIKYISMKQYLIIHKIRILIVNGKLIFKNMNTELPQQNERRCSIGSNKQWWRKQRATDQTQKDEMKKNFPRKKLNTGFEDELAQNYV